LDARGSGKDQAEFKEFTVLLKEIGIVKVFGHGLKWIQSQHKDECGGVFAVVQHSAVGEIIVAMFRNYDVLGIFNGACQPSGTETGTATDRPRE